MVTSARWDRMGRQPVKQPHPPGRSTVASIGKSTLYRTKPDIVVEVFPASNSNQSAGLVTLCAPGKAIGLWISELALDAYFEPVPDPRRDKVAAVLKNSNLINAGKDNYADLANTILATLDEAAREDIDNV